MEECVIVIEQALYENHGGSNRLLARSPGFQDDWLPIAEQLCSGFGERPPGMSCPACLFAQPFGKGHVAVVQVADQGTDHTGQPRALVFRFLIIGRADYFNLSGDPFIIVGQFPAQWLARGDLPALVWPQDAMLPRTIKQVQEVLQRPQEGPNLLGGAQVLVDGGRLVFERPGPATELLRGLWTLLPTTTRCELWPASFAFGNALGFDAVVAPEVGGEEYAGYVSGDEAGDYPEGRYELNLQIAAEAGDQAELDALFARRSRKETWRLGLMILVTCFVLAIVGNLLFRPPPPDVGKPPPAKMNHERRLPAHP
jgi:hypothetical protein